MKRIFASTLVAGMALTGFTGCAGMSPTAKGAIGGAAVGAGVGALAGDEKGALIGAGVGAAAGAVIGDQTERRRERQGYRYYR